MGGGKGQAGSPSQITTQPDPEISAFVREFREESKPVREEVFKQIAEALTTGGVGARIPIAQKSVEASRSATSAALQNIDESLGRAGIARTPFGQRTRALAELQGEQVTSSVFPSIAKELMDIAPNLAMGSASTVIQGLTNAANVGVGQGQLGLGAAGLETQASISRLQAQTAIITGVLNMIGNIAGSGKFCWIAAELYGWYTPRWYAVRRFIFERWHGPVADLVRAVYLRHGRQLARSRLFCTLVRPLFDLAVTKGA